MAYESFWQAVAAYQSAKDADAQAACAENIFVSLFEHYSSFASFRDYLTSRSSLLPRPEPQVDWKLGAPEELDENEEVDGIERIGGLLVVAGHPCTLPTQEMIDQLKGLIIPATPYMPDSVDHIPPQNLRTATLIHGSTLFVSWLRTRWGDDLQPAQRELERLSPMLKKLVGPAFIDSVLIALSERAAAQVAFVQKDYSDALKKMANSIGIFSSYSNLLNMNAIESVISEYLKDMVTAQEADIHVRVDGLIVPAPWLTNGLTDAKNYLQVAKTSARNNVNWQVVATACEVLSKAALKHRLRIHMSPFSSVEKIDYSEL